MPILELTTEIRAPIERVFNLSRSIDLHAASTAHTDERAIAGVTTGLIGLGQEVTWQAKHFGIRQTLTSRITAFERPTYFRDSMVRGAFRRFDHDHRFTETRTGTTMQDVFDYDSPFGVLGTIADSLFLASYMRRLLSIRNRVIQSVAESDEWRRYLRAG